MGMAKGGQDQDRIMHRPNKHHPAPSFWQARRNRLITPIGTAVEGLLGTMKRSYGYCRVRYFSLAGNAVHFDLLGIAINLRRAEVLTRRHPDSARNPTKPLVNKEAPLASRQHNENVHALVQPTNQPCLSGYHPHPLYVVCTHFPE